MVPILVVALMAGCDHESAPMPPAAKRLVLVRSVALAVAEPSDLCLDRDGRHWWTVSDQTGRAYRLRLSDGVIVATLDYIGNDPEGIWQDPLDGTLYVAEEALGQIVHLDATGRELGRVSVAGRGGDANSGLEGITSSSATGRFHVVKEKDPSLLLAVEPDGAVVVSREINFAADLSGITWDAASDRLLLVSDESAKVIVTDMEGNILDEYGIAVEKAEGVALDPVSGHVYVVSDSEETFYEFALEDAAAK